MTKISYMSHNTLHYSKLIRWSNIICMTLISVYLTLIFENINFICFETRIFFFFICSKYAYTLIVYLINTCKNNKKRDTLITLMMSVT